MKKVNESELWLSDLELLNALEFFGIEIKVVPSYSTYRVNFVFVRKSTQELLEINDSFFDSVSDNGNASDISSCSKTTNFHILNTLGKKFKTPLRCEVPLVMCPAKEGDDVRVCLTCKKYKNSKV